MMKIVDIAAVAAVVKKAAPDAIFVVDNTFMSPYFQVRTTEANGKQMHSIQYAIFFQIF